MKCDVTGCGFDAALKVRVGTTAIGHYCPDDLSDFINGDGEAKVVFPLDADDAEVLKAEVIE